MNVLYPNRALIENSPMSALGHKRTSSAIAIYVRFRGNSGHWMSALPPIADIGEGIAECPLMTHSGHWAVFD